MSIFAVNGLAQIPFPKLTRIHPPGGTSGTELRVTVAGAELDAPLDLIFSDSRIQADPISHNQPYLSHLKTLTRDFQVSIPQDMPRGIVRVEWLGINGISNSRSFVISDYPLTESREPSLPFSAAGEFAAGQWQEWKLQLKAGQVISAEIYSERIDSRARPRLELRNASGSLIHESRYLKLGDPWISTTAPEDGTYILRAADTAFGGGGEHFYFLEVASSHYSPDSIRFPESENVENPELPLLWNWANYPVSSPSLFWMEDPENMNTTLAALAQPNILFESFSNSTNTNPSPQLVELDEAKDFLIVGNQPPDEAQDIYYLKIKAHQPYVVSVLSTAWAQYSDFQLEIFQTQAPTEEHPNPEAGKRLTHSDDWNPLDRNDPLPWYSRDPMVSFQIQEEGWVQIHVTDLLKASSETDPVWTHPYYAIRIEARPPAFQLVTRNEQPFANDSQRLIWPMEVFPGETIGVQCWVLREPATAGAEGVQPTRDHAIRLQPIQLPDGWKGFPTIIGPNERTGKIWIQAPDEFAEGHLEIPLRIEAETVSENPLTASGSSQHIGIAWDVNNFRNEAMLFRQENGLKLGAVRAVQNLGVMKIHRPDPNTSSSQSESVVNLSQTESTRLKLTWTPGFKVVSDIQVRWIGWPGAKDQKNWTLQAAGSELEIEIPAEWAKKLPDSPTPLALELEYELEYNPPHQAWKASYETAQKALQVIHESTEIQAGLPDLIRDTQKSLEWVRTQTETLNKLSETKKYRIKTHSRPFLVQKAP